MSMCFSMPYAPSSHHDKYIVYSCHLSIFLFSSFNLLFTSLAPSVLIFCFQKRVMYWDSDDIKMLIEEYTAVPLDEKEHFDAPHVDRREYLVGDIFKVLLVVFIIAIGSFTLGFGIGKNWKQGSRWEVDKNGLLPPQAFVPDSMCFVSILT
jgi:hypothetical protein